MVLPKVQVSDTTGAEESYNSWQQNNPTNMQRDDPNSQDFCEIRDKQFFYLANFSILQLNNLAHVNRQSKPKVSAQVARVDPRRVCTKAPDQTIPPWRV